MSVNPSPRAAGSDPASGDPVPSSVRHRPSWIAFVVLGAIVCLGMGIWQLARYQDASGTVQNLGYTFMWPFLAGFLVYAYIKYVRLEADEADRLADAEHGAAAGEVAGGVPAGVGRGGDDDNDDDPVHPRPRPPGAGSRARSAGRGRRRGPVVTEIPADLLPTRRPTADSRARDEGLDAYNSYLAELAREDNRASDDHSQESPAS